VEFRLVDLIGFSFSKDSTGGHFKKFQIFLSFLVPGPKNRSGRLGNGRSESPPIGRTCPVAILRAGQPTRTLGERRESLDRGSRSGLIVGHVA